jgi:hypothetical protein
MSSVVTDLLLVRCHLAGIEGAAQAAQRFCAASGEPLALGRLAWSRETKTAYVYLVPHTPLHVDASVPKKLADLWRSLCPAAAGTEVSRMELLQDVAGRSHDAAPAFHYVVETDPEAGWEDEITRWYVQEHMPGLAAVPGCVEARRFRNHDAGPRSHACYSLLTQDTLGSPPWLAIRHTDWSSRVRPHFMNTRRTMFEIAAVIPEPLHP